MDSLKNHITELKRKKNSLDNQNLIKYSDVIKEKIKFNKKDSILKKFDKIINENNQNNEENKINLPINSQNSSKNDQFTENVSGQNHGKELNEINLPDIKEVFKRLRERKQPITLFGETENQRYQRLLLAESGKFNPENQINEEIKLDYDEIDIDDDLKHIEEDICLFKNKKEWIVTVKPEE